MKMLRLGGLTASFLLTLTTARAANPADEVIAKARAYLGSESALNAVRSIHFSGMIEFDEKTKLPVDIVFQKPYQQRVSASSDKLIETTALDSYDGWTRRQDPANPTKWQLQLLEKEQIKRLQANTWENLNFFQGIEKRGGRVDFLGDAKADGRDCVKLAFVHAPSIIFYRYFDKATGQLVLTETESGATIREEGEVIVNGVRFPHKVINKNTDGKMTTITFEEVAVNEAFAPSEFAVPSLMPESSAKPTPPLLAK